jgi:hypothetical protein
MREATTRASSSAVRGTGRRVGTQQQTLVLHGGTGGFQHDGGEDISMLAPSSQAFEAVDELVGAVGASYGAQRQWRAVLERTHGRAGTQGSVVGAQVFDGEEHESAGHMIRRGGTEGNG